METLLVLTNVPDQASAKQLAADLVSKKLAACVNILAPCQSVYRWEGKVEHTTEVTMLIKTVAARYAELEQAICTAHPYDVPEIIAIPLTYGLPAYLKWVAAETMPNSQAEV